MIEPTLDRLQADIAERGKEIYASRNSGFVPLNHDVRTQPMTVPDANPLSAVAPPDTRFVVAGPDGRQLFTRAGDFQAANGILQTTQGAAVLGYAPGASMLAPLAVPSTDRMFGRVENLHVERDGNVVYERKSFDPRTRVPRRERVSLGTIALARFPAGSEPTRTGNFERAPIGVEAFIGRPDDGHFAALQVRRHESGALDLNVALARLHDAYQQLDAVTAAQRVGKNTAKTVMDIVK
jgi:hypothetical protein